MIMSHRNAHGRYLFACARTFGESSDYHFSGASRNIVSISRSEAIVAPPAGAGPVRDSPVIGANPQAPIQWADHSSFESMTARCTMVPQRPWQSGQPRDMAPPPHSSQSDQPPAPQSAPQLVQ
jgi:hypothetical protein